MVENYLLLKDVCEIKTGKLDANAKVKDGEYPFFTCDPSPLRIDHYAYDCECVLIGGNNANGNFPINYYKGKFNAYQRTYIITTKLDSIVPLKYIMYHMEKELMVLKRRSAGSLTKFLTMGILENIKIPLLSKGEYDQIGDNIFFYENKISQNKNFIQSLEEYSQLLFHKWFIDFNFPNEQGKPYKDSSGEMIEVGDKLIPSHWEYRTLKGDFEIDNGISYTTESVVSGEGVPMINLGSFSLDGEYLHEKLLYYSGDYQEEKIIRPNDLVVACTDLTRNADIIGQSFLVPESFGDKYLLSMDAVCIKINEDSTLTNEFLNYLYKQSHYREFIKRYANGTNVLHLAKRGLHRFKTPIPNKDLIQKFTKLVKVTHKKKSLLMKENLLLAERRDLLIRKLIK